MLSSYGKITIDGKSVGKYTVNADGINGEFTLNGIKYTIRYDIQTKQIVVLNEQGEEIGNLSGYDSLANITLTNQDRTTKYTFNGKSLIGIGAGTRTDINGETSFTYELIGNKIIIVIDGENKVEMEIQDNGEILVGGEKYTLLTSLSGEWIVGETGETLKIGNIRMDGSVEELIFGIYDVASSAMYDIQRKTITFSLNETKYEISSLVGGYISLKKNGITSIVCIAQSEVDDYKGEWISQDNGKVRFDGLGNAKSYGGGTITIMNKENDIVGVYKYTFNEKGKLQFVMNNLYHVFVKAEGNDEKAFEKDGEYYSIKQPDMVYDITATVDGSAMTYYFDGLGTAVTSGNDEYSYEILDFNLTAKTVKLKIASQEGTERIATLDYTGRIVKLIFDEQ